MKAAAAPQLEDYTKWSQTAMGSMKELQELTAKTIEKLMAQQMAVMNSYVELTSKQMSALTEAKGVDQLMSSQTALMNAYSTAFMDSLKRAADVVNESKDEYTAWLNKAFSQKA